jgi:Papain-like cysteine protease AvrRpt2
MLRPIPLAPDLTRPVAAGHDVRLLDVRPIGGVAIDGCVLASAAMVCAYYGIAGVSQRGLARTCGVAFPPVGGMHIATMAQALRSHGVAARVVQHLSAGMIRSSIMAGHPILGGHAVDRAVETGHAVVICGWFAWPGKPALVAVADPNIGFRMLVEAATMVGSARSAILLRHDVRGRAA